MDCRVILRQLFAIGLVLALPALAHAQNEATIVGTVTDASGAVLPGVTITDTHVASGNTVTAVSDERGEFRLPVRVGENKVVAELSGFNTQTSDVVMLVGQQATVNLKMTIAGVQEQVSVTAVAPILDTTTSKVGGNIDSNQMAMLPVQGRNYLDLTLMAAGSRGNATADTPYGEVGTTQIGFGLFQLNVDGQQITQNCCSGAGGQPRFGQDSISELNFVERFDVTEGRSAGIQINVISKSGTNTNAGMLDGYFRSSSDGVAEPDFVAHTVLPYSDQEYSGSFGGPIIKDKVQYFVNEEIEHENDTYVYQATGPLAVFNTSPAALRKEDKGDIRFDFQLPGQMHFELRANNWHNDLPIDPSFSSVGATANASTAVSTNRYSDQINGLLSKVLSSKTLNEFKFSYSGQRWGSDSSYICNWTGGPNTFAGPLPGSGTNCPGAPLLTFSGYEFGTPANIPQYIGQQNINFRDDFMTAYEAGGRHDVHIGGEYQNYLVWHNWCNGFNGSFVYSSGANAVKPPANIAALIPNITNPATWNMLALDQEDEPINSSQEIGSCRLWSPRNIMDVFYQDDWRVSDRLTVNLGIRWDGETDTWANEISLPPFEQSGRPDPLVNISPRGGFAYKVNDKTTIRGGTGIYYSEVINQPAHDLRIDAQQLKLILNNSPANPEFAIDPWIGAVYGGIAPSFTTALNSFCSVTGALSGCTPRSFSSSMANPYQSIPYSFQASLGAQRQIAQTMAFESNFVFTGLRDNRLAETNANLLYNPATGANFPWPSDTAAATVASEASRAFPGFGAVPIDWPYGISNQFSWENQFTKRFSDHWQLQATYTLSFLYDTIAPLMTGVDAAAVTGAALPQDLTQDYGLAQADQRHRATLNGIWQIGKGFQASGLFFFGSGQRVTNACGVDPRDTDNQDTLDCNANELASAGILGTAFVPGTTILERNSLVGMPVYRVDARLMKRFNLPSTLKVDATLDCYNVFNHANYGSYTTSLASTSYGLPAQLPGAVAFYPRTLQFGFRFTF